MNRFNYGLLAGVVAVMPVFSLGAQEVGQCAIKPTCASMGYQQKEADCTGKNMLKCPFDNTIVFCGGTACATDFTLLSCDSSKGTCEECGGKYKYTACNNGWTLSANNCTPKPCTGFDLTSCPANGNCGTCKSGTTTKYKLNSCKSGYVVNGNSCAINPCTGYNLTSCPSGGYCLSCQSGTTTKRKLGHCREGWLNSSKTACVDQNCGYESSGVVCGDQPCCLYGCITGYVRDSLPLNQNNLQEINGTCIGEDTGATYKKITCKPHFCPDGSQSGSYEFINGCNHYYSFMGCEEGI